MSDTFTLPAEVTVYTVGELRTELLAWLSAAADAGDTTATLEGGAVQEVDGAGVQLLVALGHSLRGRGMTWRWTGASDVLRAACAELGCDKVLGLAQATPAEETP